MRSTTLLALLVAASSPLAVLSSLMVSYGRNSPTTSVKSAASTKTTAMSGSKKKVVVPPGGGVKGTNSTYGPIESGGSRVTDTGLGPAITGLNNYHSQKQYVPPRQGASSILTGADSTDTALSPTDTSGACLFDDIREEEYDSESTSSVTSALDTLPTGTYGNQNQHVPPAGRDNSITTDTMMPTDTMASSSTTSSLAGYTKRQTGATISPATSPTTLSTSTITDAPLSSYNQRQQVQTGATTTKTALVSAESDFMMDIVLPGSKTISAEVSEFTGAGGSKKVVIKKLGCGGKSASRRQKVNPSPKRDITGTATGTFDLGSPTSSAL